MKPDPEVFGRIGEARVPALSSAVDRRDNPPSDVTARTLLMQEGKST